MVGGLMLSPDMAAAQVCCAIFFYVLCYNITGTLCFSGHVKLLMDR